MIAVKVKIQDTEYVDNTVKASPGWMRINACFHPCQNHRKITQDDAFALLRKASQHLHRKLRDIAAEVVETGTMPELPSTPTGSEVNSVS